MVFVGRVTGIVDCLWADSKTGTVDYAYVPLGRKYALASGLMEITYNTAPRSSSKGLAPTKWNRRPAAISRSAG